MNEVMYGQFSVYKTNKTEAAVLKDKIAIMETMKAAIARGMTNFELIQQLENWRKPVTIFKRF